MFWLLVCSALAWATAGLAAEASPALPVRYTEARAHDVARSVRVTGSVEAPRRSVVATEVAGVVGKLVVREGSKVRAGEPLVELRREPTELRLAAARGQLAEAEARLGSARLKLERTRELHGSEVVSRQQVDDAAYETQAWEGRGQQLRAEVAQLERDLANTIVKAPFGGVVSRELAQPGQWLDVGAAVAELIALDLLEVRLEVPERYFAELTAGAKAAVTFDAIPGLQTTGKLRAVVPSADPRARTFPALISLERPDRRIGAGMLAHVELPVGGTEPSVIVPKDALVEDGRRTVVYVIEDDGAVRRVEVETGSGVGAWVVVRGVAAGAKVVTRGNERLETGQRVSGEPLEVPLP